MAVLGCQPISPFPAWSCQWKSFWKNSRKELSFLHSIDQVNTLPRVALKRLLWCFRVEKCILNVKRCLVIFKTEHEKAQQKEHCAVVRCTELYKEGCAGKTKGPSHPGRYPAPCISPCWIPTKESKKQASYCFLLSRLCYFPQDSWYIHQGTHPTDDNSTMCNSESNSCAYQDIAILLPTHLKEKFACFKTRLGGRGITLQLCSACS